MNSKKPDTDYVVKFIGIFLAFIFLFIGMGNANFLYNNGSSIPTASWWCLFISEIIFFLVSGAMFIIFLED